MNNAVEIAVFMQSVWVSSTYEFTPYFNTDPYLELTEWDNCSNSEKIGRFRRLQSRFPEGCSGEAESVNHESRDGISMGTRDAFDIRVIA